jgi:hypothetical protein
MLHKVKLVDDNITQPDGPCLASGAVCEELVGLSSMGDDPASSCLDQVVLLAVNSALKALQPFSMSAVPKSTVTIHYMEL